MFANKSSKLDGHLAIRASSSALFVAISDIFEDVPSGRCSLNMCSIIVEIWALNYSFTIIPVTVAGCMSFEMMTGRLEDLSVERLWGNCGCPLACNGMAIRTCCLGASTANLADNSPVGVAVLIRASIEIVEMKTLLKCMVRV